MSITQSFYENRVRYSSFYRRNSLENKQEKFQKYSGNSSRNEVRFSVLDPRVSKDFVNSEQWVNEQCGCICSLEWRCGPQDLCLQSFQYYSWGDPLFKGQLKVPTELQSLWSVEIMLNILWLREGVPSLRELGGTPKRISTCHHVIFHELFLSPLGKTALRPPHITFKVSSKVIFGKTSVLSAHQKLLFLPGLAYALFTRAMPLVAVLGGGRREGERWRKGMWNPSKSTDNNLWGVECGLWQRGDYLCKNKWGKHERIWEDLMRVSPLDCKEIQPVHPWI